MGRYALGALALGLAASSLVVGTDEVIAEAAVDDVYDITFPVAGPTYYSDSFYACRDGCSRTHGATDIMTYGLKGVPVVAAHAGTIKWMANEQGGRCCAIWGLVHEDGWETWYIHMNNDTPGTDDGLVLGFAAGIVPGATVEEGQLLGWVGDSGNAERVSPHLHFEIRDAAGDRVNPYYSLGVAKRNLLPRVAGADRFATAAAISEEAFPDGAVVAYVATGSEFADALAGGPAAALAGGPVLLTRSGSLPQTTADELTRLDPNKIVILGGLGAVGDRVETRLRGLAPEVERLFGVNRYATAAAISAAHHSAGASTVYVANAEAFADALAGAPAAAIDGAPLLLVVRDSVPAATAEELERLRANRIVILGGEAVISADVVAQLAALTLTGDVVRLAGADRYETAAEISAFAFPTVTTAFVATGLGFADALAGVSLAASSGSPILLVDDPLSDAIAAELVRLGPEDVTILGGTGAVSGDVETDLWTLLNGDFPTW